MVLDLARDQFIVTKVSTDQLPQFPTPVHARDSYCFRTSDIAISMFRKRGRTLVPAILLLPRMSNSMFVPSRIENINTFPLTVPETEFLKGFTCEPPSTSTVPVTRPSSWLSVSLIGQEFVVGVFRTTHVYEYVPSQTPATLTGGFAAVLPGTVAQANHPTGATRAINRHRRTADLLIRHFPSNIVNRKKVP